MSEKKEMTALLAYRAHVPNSLKACPTNLVSISTHARKLFLLSVPFLPPLLRQGDILFASIISRATRDKHTQIVRLDNALLAFSNALCLARSPHEAVTCLMRRARVHMELGNLLEAGDDKLNM